MQWYHQRAAADLATEDSAKQAAVTLATAATTTTAGQVDAEPNSFVDSDTPDDDSQGNAMSRPDVDDSAVADSAHEELSVSDESAAGSSGSQQSQLYAEGEPSATWGHPDPPLLDLSHEQAPESTNACTAAAAVTALSTTADTLQQNTDSARLPQEAAMVDTPELGSLCAPASTDIPPAAVAALTEGSSLSSAAGSTPAVAQAQPAMAQAEAADHPSTADSLQGSQVNSTRSGSPEAQGAAAAVAHTVNQTDNSMQADNPEAPPAQAPPPAAHDAPSNAPPTQIEAAGTTAVLLAPLLPTFTANGAAENATQPMTPCSPVAEDSGSAGASHVTQAETLRQAWRVLEQELEFVRRQSEAREREVAEVKQLMSQMDEACKVALGVQAGFRREQIERLQAGMDTCKGSHGELNCAQHRPCCSALEAVPYACSAGVHADLVSASVCYSA